MWVLGFWKQIFMLVQQAFYAQVCLLRPYISFLSQEE